MNEQMRQQEWLQIFLERVRGITIPVHVKEEEGYKFQAVQQFQANFDIEATDLAGNLDASLVNNNLVSGAMYFPKKMLLIYAQTFPEETRAILKLLFDENEDIGFRIDQAKQAFEDLESRRDDNNKFSNTYIGLRFLSLLLSYYDPNQYNALKPAEWKVFCRFVDPEFSIPNRTPAGEQYKIYNSYIEPLRAFLKTRREISEIKDALTNGLIFKDDEYRWMTQDVIFVTARAYADKRGQELSQNEPTITNQSTQIIEPETIRPDDFNTGFMAYEQHLEEYVIKNWANIDFGEKLEIYIEDDGTTGQQYTTDVGILDILAVDEHGDFVVIELKRAESGYKVVGQVLNYMGWVQDKLALEGQKVRGMVIVGKADKTLRAAVRPVEDKISLKEYRIQMSLEDINGN